MQGKNNKQKMDWIIDAVLFLGFLVCCLLDLTGLELHQWLGVVVGTTAAWHLLRHWQWVRAVSRRFFARTSSQARLYYLLDVTILVGFATIGVTGLAISTWFSLPLANYELWRTWHVTATIMTAGTVLVKIALHWRWIVMIAQRQIMPSGAQRPLPAPRTMPMSPTLDRRAFLTLMGSVGAASVVPLSRAVLALGVGMDTTQAQSQSMEAVPATPTPATEATLAQAQAVLIAPTPTAQATTIQAGSATSSATATPAAPTGSTAVGASSTTTCVVRCDKRCSYPGRCRKYVDANKNGRCDLGECV